MSDALVAAREYLQATPEAFWRWTDGGTVLTWKHGETIAFLPEVRAVLGRLADRGLPPFPAVVLALAACRGNMAAQDAAVWNDESVEYVGAGTSVFDRLKQIQELP